mgnify:FL=1
MNIKEKVEEYEKYTKDLRRWFHRFPEKSGEEKMTHKKIITELSNMNIECKVVGNYGVIGILKGNNPGKTILLRADMDALPIEENKYNLSKKRDIISTVDGISHMCGHDCHMAIMLTVAQIFANMKDEIKGTILFCFESGEEDGSGVKDMIKALENEQIDGVWGIHVMADLPIGKISVNSGVRMSGSSKFNVVIKGKGGHGSRPDQSIDPINCTAQILCSLSSIQSRIIDPRDTIVLTVGKLHAGEAINIIPETASFGGTIRFYDYNTEEQVKEAFYTIVNNIAIANNCKAEIAYDGPKPPVINNPTLSQMAEKSIEKVIGKEALFHMKPWLASDTIGRYTSKYPGVYAFLGIKNDKIGTGAPHHNSKFDVDESSLTIGIATTVQFVIDFLDI